MLCGDDRLYYGSNVVDIWECFDAEEDIVKGRFRRLGGFFGAADN